MRFILGVIVGLALIPIGALIFLHEGWVPVATASAPLPFEKRLAGMGLDAMVSKEAPKNAPFTADEQTYIAGAQVYREDCAVCHSLPQQQPSGIAKGMYPRPPQLLKGKGVTDDPVGETYWKVANGIRLTGMPGFKTSLTDQQIWQVSMFLANADKLPASALEVLSTSPTAPAAAAAPKEIGNGNK